MNPVNNNANDVNGITADDIIESMQETDDSSNLPDCFAARMSRIDFDLEKAENK